VFCAAGCKNCRNFYNETHEIQRAWDKAEIARPKQTLGLNKIAPPAVRRFADFRLTSGAIHMYSRALQRNGITTLTDCIQDRLFHVEAISVHNFVPCPNEIANKLRMAIGRTVNLSNRTQL
jgi:hypothetical protein